MIVALAVFVAFFLVVFFDKIIHFLFFSKHEKQEMIKKNNKEMIYKVYEFYKSDNNRYKYPSEFNKTTEVSQNYLRKSTEEEREDITEDLYEINKSVIPEFIQQERDKKLNNLLKLK